MALAVHTKRPTLVALQPHRHELALSVYVIHRAVRTLTFPTLSQAVSTWLAVRPCSRRRHTGLASPTPGLALLVCAPRNWKLRARARCLHDLDNPPISRFEAMLSTATLESSKCVLTICCVGFGHASQCSYPCWTVTPRGKRHANLELRSTFL